MKLKNLNITLSLALLLSLFLVSCAAKMGTKQQGDSGNSNANKPKQNILFISIDDLRPLINSYGATKMITPNMDKLASKGVQFNNAFTNIAVFLEPTVFNGDVLLIKYHTIKTAGNFKAVEYNVMWL